VISKFLLEAYDSLTEISLWLLFIAAAFAGYSTAGIEGAAIALVVSGISAVFLVAPFMMISDIRKSVARMEAKGSAGGSVAQGLFATPAKSHSSAIAPAPSQKSESKVASKSWGHVKDYKGYEIARSDGNVVVDGNMFDGISQAEAWIDTQPKK
jgi:hypothetical protein